MWLYHIFHKTGIILHIPFRKLFFVLISNYVQGQSAEPAVEICPDALSQLDSAATPPKLANDTPGPNSTPAPLGLNSVLPQPAPAL